MYHAVPRKQTDMTLYSNSKEQKYLFVLGLHCASHLLMNPGSYPRVLSNSIIS